jgi:hypothetical protein
MKTGEERPGVRKNGRAGVDLNFFVSFVNFVVRLFLGDGLGLTFSPFPRFPVSPSPLSALSSLSTGGFFVLFVVILFFLGGSCQESLFACHRSTIGVDCYMTLINHMVLFNNGEE